MLGVAAEPPLYTKHPDSITLPPAHNHLATRAFTRHKGAKGGQPKGDFSAAVTPRGGHLSDQMRTPALMYTTTSTNTRWLLRTHQQRVDRARRCVAMQG